MDEKLKEEYRRTLEEYYALRREYEELVNRIMELEAYSDFLKELKEKEEWNGFTNLGGMILVRSKVLDTKKVLVNVGSNIFVEKNVDEVMNLLKDQVIYLMNVKQEMEKALEKYSEKLSELKEKLEKSSK